MAKLRRSGPGQDPWKFPWMLLLNLSSGIFFSGLSTFRESLTKLGKKFLQIGTFRYWIFKLKSGGPKMIILLTYLHRILPRPVLWNIFFQANIFRPLSFKTTRSFHYPGFLKKFWDKTDSTGIGKWLSLQSVFFCGNGTKNQVSWVRLSRSEIFCLISYRLGSPTIWSSH